MCVSTPDVPGVLLTLEDFQCLATSELSLYPWPPLQVTSNINAEVDSQNRVLDNMVHRYRLCCSPSALVVSLWDTGHAPMASFFRASRVFRYIVQPV